MRALVVLSLAALALTACGDDEQSAEQQALAAAFVDLSQIERTQKCEAWRLMPSRYDEIGDQFDLTPEQVADVLVPLCGIVTS